MVVEGEGKERCLAIKGRKELGGGGLPFRRWVVGGRRGEWGWGADLWKQENGEEKSLSKALEKNEEITLKRGKMGRQKKKRVENGADFNR